jgi:murein DD-endopeptidase MepM/ murein hydrolase activator NlpD
VTACCGPNAHRDLRLAIDGRRIETGEIFAVDWGLLEGNRLFEGDGSTNEQFFGFGADVLAVADGTVVFTQDGEPEQTPGEAKLAEKRSQIGGNKVILQIAPKVFAAYQHLQPGSLTVKVGDKVKAGAILAKLGNTGPSTGPHLHFGLLDRPDVFLGRALPFVFDRDTLAGTVDIKTHRATKSSSARAAGSFGVSALGQHPELPLVLRLVHGIQPPGWNGSAPRCRSAHYEGPRMTTTSTPSSVRPLRRTAIVAAATALALVAAAAWRRFG